MQNAVKVCLSMRKQTFFPGIKIPMQFQRLCNYWGMQTLAEYCFRLRLPIQPTKVQNIPCQYVYESGYLWTYS